MFNYCKCDVAPIDNNEAYNLIYKLYLELHLFIGHMKNKTIIDVEYSSDGRYYTRYYGIFKIYSFIYLSPLL